MRCPASGAPSPARRTVADIQKTPLLLIRSTLPAPLGSLLAPPVIDSVGAIPSACAGSRSLEAPDATTNPPAASRLRRLRKPVVMQILLIAGTHSVDGTSTRATRPVEQVASKPGITGL